MIIKRLGAICAGLALGTLAAPAAAQQTPPDQASVPPAPPPPAEQLPVPATVPPPFPPMPSARPSHRWVDVGHHAARRHATGNHARPRHHARRNHRATDPAAKTMRWCAAMTTRQMLRHKVCRAMAHAYRQAVKPHPHASRRHHKAAGHHGGRRHRR